MDKRLILNEVDRAQLIHSGVQGQVFVQRPFALEDTLGLIDSTTATGKPKAVKAAHQLEKWEKLAGNPLAAPYVVCISSIGTDLKAKYVAAYLLNKAILLHRKQMARTIRSGPIWHMITGSYSDEYRDRMKKVRESKKPALIVLSNTTADSSEVKVEKLRDLLEAFSDVPRIVTLTGSDPYTFFVERLHYPLNVGLYLSKGPAPLTRGRHGRPPKLREDLAANEPTKLAPARRMAKVTSRTAEV